MQRLSWRQRLADERGATAVLLAIMLGSGVLVLSVGLVVDSGRLFLERRVLQTSADTVAVTVAQACATYDLNPSAAVAADCENPPANISSAMELSGFARIPNDVSQTEVYDICGSSATLAACTAASIGKYECQSPVDATNSATFAHVVRAYTRTTEAGATGGTALYPVFQPLLAGAPEGTRLSACAQVAWVHRSIANIPSSTYMPFAISACDYGQTSHVIVGNYASSSTCASITDHEGQSTSCGGTGCQSGVVGFSYSPPAGCASISGGKLSLAGTSNSINAPSSGVCVKATIGSAPSPGVNNLKLAINGTFSNSTTPESVYTVPIFDKITRPASTNTINIVGFGYFKLQGYKFPGGVSYTAAGHSVTWPASCGATGGAGNTWCIYGKFEPHVYSNSPSSELTEISRPAFWDGTFAIKRIP